MSPPLSAMEDVELVRSAQAGDALAMSRLLDVLVPYVGRICAPIALGSAQDAAQEALIQVLRDLRALRDPGALRSWVRRIATREAVRHAQRSRRDAGEDGAGRELPASGSPDLTADVRSTLQALSPQQRAILVLRDLEGFSEEEAAELLGVARGTAKSRLSRARGAVRERWDS